MESTQLSCHHCKGVVQARETHCIFEGQVWCPTCASDEFQIRIGHEAAIKRFLVQAVTLFSAWAAVLVGWAFSTHQIMVSIAIGASWISHRVLSEGVSIPAGVQVMEDGQSVDPELESAFPIFLSFMLLFRSRRFTLAVILGLLAVLMVFWWRTPG
jgi:hypothetical protein